MRLDALIGEAGVTQGALLLQVVGDPATEVIGVAMDSRAVTPGVVFACVPGRRSDGHDFAPAAVAGGATALVCERLLDLAVPQVLVSSVRRCLGPLADAAQGHPSRALTVVGVTGTNGKTTTCALLHAIFQAHGWSAVTLGTLTQHLTTPDAPELQGRLAEVRDRGGHAVAMEVSSHALDQCRVDAVQFAAGVLTNVTQDHLDYHRTMSAYFEAKAKLFSPDTTRVAVVNRSDRWGRVLLERLAGSEMPVATFSVDDAEGLELGAGGSTFRWGGRAMRVRLGGRFNVENALAAATCARELGIPSDSIAAGLASVASVRGRFEPVDAGQSFTVLIDYAHTPDGLAQALRAARELTSGRLLVVFGAGGDRDHDKRPLMGRVASELADLAVVTSDNPRSEDPAAIVDAVVSGAIDRSRVVVELDRSRAIAAAVASAAPGDVVVVAGKGHETGQDIGGRVHPFDDAAVAREAIQRILASRRDRGQA